MKTLTMVALGGIALLLLKNKASSGTLGATGASDIDIGYSGEKLGQDAFTPLIPYGSIIGSAYLATPEQAAAKPVRGDSRFATSTPVTTPEELAAWNAFIASGDAAKLGWGNPIAGIGYSVKVT